MAGSARRLGAGPAARPQRDVRPPTRSLRHPFLRPLRGDCLRTRHWRERKGLAQVDSGSGRRAACGQRARHTHCNRLSCVVPTASVQRLRSPVPAFAVRALRAAGRSRVRVPPPSPHKFHAFCDCGAVPPSHSPLPRSPLSRPAIQEHMRLSWAESSLDSAIANSQSLRSAIPSAACTLAHTCVAHHALLHSLRLFPPPSPCAFPLSSVLSLPSPRAASSLPEQPTWT